jgi:hypothetical protein
MSTRNGLYSIWWGLVALGAGAAQAATVTIDFDGPDYSPGQSIGRIGDVNILPAGTVFTPSVPTFTGTQALRAPANCDSAACTNNAYRMEFRFGDALPFTSGWLYKPAQRVSLRVGVSTLSQGCFPEGSSCAMYASLAAFDRNGDPVVAPQDVFLFDASMPPTLPITREISVFDPQARIARVSLTYGKGTVSHDIGFAGEPQIDHLVVEFPDAPVASTPPPAAPTITITEPSGSRAPPFNLRLRGAVNVPGGLAAFCYRVNSAMPVSGVGCTDLGRLQSNNTFDIDIPDHVLAAGTNSLSVRVYDTYGQVATQTATVITLPPPPPEVSISIPSANQWLNPSQINHVLGRVRTLGALKGFCVRIDNAAPPAAGTCSQDLGAVSQVNTAYQPLSFDKALASGQVAAGQHTLSVFAVDRWDQLGRADVTVNAPTDLRVVGMEISQGIQTFDIPLNTAGTAPYSGVNLRQGVPTVVRVFANTPFAGHYTGVSMLLNGFRPDPQFGESPLGGLLPDSRPPELFTGTLGVPPEMRYRANGGFVFTLPNSWTSIQGLRLEAKLVLPFGLQECASCAANNDFSVTGINFGPAVSVTASPVRLTFTDPVTGVFMAPPPGSAGLFAPAANISPVPPSAFIVRPYVGTVDVTGVVSAGGLCRSVAKSCEDLVHRMVVAFNLLSPQPGTTIGVGPVDVGLDIPMLVRKPPLGQFEFGHIAIADTRAPMLAVAHEFYHSLNYFHASPCGNSDLYNLWPPDQQGFIHGVGLDRTRRPNALGVWNGTYTIKMPGTGSLLGGTDNFYDLMSYCANEFTAWISVENWNSFGGALPNGLIPDQLVLGEATATITTDGSTKSEQGLEVEGGALLASVVLDEERRAVLMRVDPAGDRIYEDPVKGEYDFVVRDRKGLEIARLPATVTLRQRGEQPAVGVLATAYLPARDAAAVELRFHDEAVARLARSQAAPVLEMAPLEQEKVSREDTIELRWKSWDEDSQDLEARVEFSPGREQPFRAVFLGTDRGAARIDARLLSSTRDGRLRLVVRDGFNETAREIGPIVVQPAAPQLEIRGVEFGGSYPRSTPLRLQAAAFGEGQLPLPDEAIRWSLDGRELEAGAEVEIRDLEPGKHVARVVALEGKLESFRELGFEVRAQDP